MRDGTSWFTTMRQPSLFISHGAPTLALDDNAATRFLASLGRQVSGAEAILCVSAHWQASRPTVSLAQWPATIHDFGGFDARLSTLTYTPAGAPEVAERAAQRLEAAGIAAARNPERGLDHGAWVPLRHMLPEADIPVAQLSIVSSLDAADHLALGRALAPLRDEGVVILGSGGAVHPLGLPGLRFGGETPAWVAAFDDWLTAAVEAGDHAALARFREAPGADKAQFYPDHFMPLLVAAGAGHPQAAGQSLYRETVLGAFTLSAYAWP